MKLQVDLELPIDKRAGRMFGPPTGKKINLLHRLESYRYMKGVCTQNSIALLTQLLQHGTIFDRADLLPEGNSRRADHHGHEPQASGSRDLRKLGQIQFATFSCAMPSTTDLQTIYEQIFNGHVERFDKKAKETAPFIVCPASIGLIDKVAAKFLPPVSDSPTSGPCAR